MMKNYEGYIVAKSPIHTGSDDRLGNESILRRMVFLVDGRPMEIPVISGNSIRGILRRKIMKDMLTTVGYEPKSATKYTKLHHMLFSGGTLESVENSDKGYIALKLKSDIRQGIPPVALFGTAIRNQMIEGKLAVSFAIPICRELLSYLPDSARGHPQASLSINSMLTEDFITRRDDLREERAEGEQAIQMIVHYEVFAPGVTFYHRFSLKEPSSVEEAILGRAIELWQSEPYLGARAAGGYGAVKLQYPAIDPAPWVDYMTTNKDSIAKVLAEIEG